MQTRPNRQPLAKHGALLGVLGMAIGACGGAAVQMPDRLRVRATLEPQQSGTGALLQAVSAVTDEVVWVSGHQGEILRSVDGGDTWRSRLTLSLDSLQFRDIHGFDAQRAVALTAGTGPLSRIYRTTDGGGTWSLSFLMDSEQGFLDCLDFLDASHGFAYGDAIDRSPFLLETKDGGETWTRVASELLPDAGAGEGGFAASGTCARAAPGGRFWVATGAGGNARLLRLPPGGTRWEAIEAPVVRGEAAGLTTVSFASAEIGLALGGDLAQMEARTQNIILTTDGGATWSAGGPLRLVGPVYGSAFWEGSPVAVAVGPGGADLTEDRGRSWDELADQTFWAVDIAREGVGWMVGPEGRITRVRLRP